MSKIKDYIIVSAAHYGDVEDRVKHYLGEGYELHGPLALAKERTVLYAQAMVLKETQNAAPKPKPKAKPKETKK